MSKRVRYSTSYYEGKKTETYGGGGRRKKEANKGGINVRVIC